MPDTDPAREKAEAIVRKWLLDHGDRGPISISEVFRSMNKDAEYFLISAIAEALRVPAGCVRISIQPQMGGCAIDCVPNYADLDPHSEAAALARTMLASVGITGPNSCGRWANTINKRLKLVDDSARGST